MTVAEIKPYDALIAQLEASYNLDSAPEPAYKPNALTVFNKRYPRKDADGEPTETPKQVHWRIDQNVASVTVLYRTGAQWEEGDPEPEVVDPAEIPFPFKTIVRQYNWMNQHGQRLKPFWDVIANGLEAWVEQAVKYYDMTAQLIFIPNSPTWTGAGTPLLQLAACFVLPINDALVDGPSNIMKTLRDAVAIQKTGGGNGFSFGRLRPAGWVVSSSMGQSTGVVGFLRMYNATFEEIRQGGSRRGANMGVCPVWHPDVLQFITCKTNEGEIENFNISVGVTYRFLDAVENDEQWEFRWPGPNGKVTEVEWNGEMVSSVPARELWKMIVENAHVLGDPGLLFIDEANHFNPCPKFYILESTNPCGEQWLGPYENCCLGSIAVQHFVRADGTFDWERFDYYHYLAAQFLDDVVDANGYVASVPELEYAAQNGRRIGLGQMGVADALAKLRNPLTGQIGVRYGSPEGLEFESLLAERMRYMAMKASIDRARERGAFPWIEESRYDPRLLKELGTGAAHSGVMIDGETPFAVNLWEPPKPQVQHTVDFGQPVCDWDGITEGITAHGIRNSAQTTFAPTGTIATTAGVEGYGCEPIFALTYTRTVMQEGEDIELEYASDLFREALEREGLSEAEILEIAAAVKANGGSCQGLEQVPANVRHVFVTAGDLTPTEHVMSQAVLQAWVDNSISKTINFRKEATYEDVDSAYKLAAKTGCKGITIYRQGSRKREVLAVGNAPETGTIEVLDREHWPLIKPLPLPEYVNQPGKGLPQTGYATPTPFGKLWIDVAELREYPGRPYHIKTSIGKAGEDVPAFMEAVGRLFSWGLRLGGDALDGAEQLIGIGGETREQTLRPDKALSVPDALGKFIRDHMRALAAVSDGEVVVTVSPLASPETNGEYQVNRGNLCPQCRKATLAYLEGCTKCMSPGCDYNKCG